MLIILELNQPQSNTTNQGMPKNMRHDWVMKKSAKNQSTIHPVFKPILSLLPNSSFYPYIIILDIQCSDIGTTIDTSINAKNVQQ